MNNLLTHVLVQICIDEATKLNMSTMLETVEDPEQAKRHTSCSSARTCCSMDALVAAVRRCSVDACLRASSAPLLALIAFMACKHSIKTSSAQNYSWALQRYAPPQLPRLPMWRPPPMTFPRTSSQCIFRHLLPGIPGALSTSATMKEVYTAALRNCLSLTDLWQNCKC